MTGFALHPEAYDDIDEIRAYIGTESVEINLARIKNRVLAGGHNVPEPDVRRRYKRSFANLLAACQRADHIILFDNSTEEGYRLVAVLGASGDRPDFSTAFHKKNSPSCDEQP